MPEDEQDIFALRSSDEINKYLDRPKANTLDDARNFITKIINGIAKNESIFWVVTPKDRSKFLGSICLWKISREEAKAKLKTIEAELSPRNLKSVKLLEKNNFTLAAINPENPDSVVYSLKKSP